MAPLASALPDMASKTINIISKPRLPMTAWSPAPSPPSEPTLDLADATRLAPAGLPPGVELHPLTSTSLSLWACMSYLTCAKASQPLLQRFSESQICVFPRMRIQTMAYRPSSSSSEYSWVSASWAARFSFFVGYSAAKLRQMGHPISRRPSSTLKARRKYRIRLSSTSLVLDPQYTWTEWIRAPVLPFGTSIVLPSDQCISLP